MIPELFRVGPISISSFGAMVALAVVVGLWLLHRELARRQLPREVVDVAAVAVLTGLAGAKALWVFEHRGEEPLWDLVFSRAGLSWFGGLAAGLWFALWQFHRRRWALVPVLAAATPALVVGHAIGRVGCFLVGDDYGRPTSLPWGVAFPDGLPPTTVPVHPTQLYELAALLPFAWWLVRMRRRHAADHVVLATYLVGTGVIRFAIEFLRVNQRVLGPLTVAHVASLGLLLAGGWLLSSRHADRLRTG